MADTDSSPATDDGGPGPALFGTFTGVFTPTFLTILGVIMYVRVGWAVGNAGLGGTWLVMGVAMLITTCTALSLSSVATNTRLGPGGPYAILTRSLGFEVGGSIGVPLYLTRPLGVAMYIIGFREGWLWIFPDHPALLVDLCVFVVLAGISYVSANLAFRVQFLIMAIIVASLLSIFGSDTTFQPATEIQWWGDYHAVEGGGADGFWTVFAVFFPATTGILAGANMSGDLEDPRRAIPVGTLWALALSSVIYFAVAWWCARAGTPTELTANYNFAIDEARYPALVLAGLLGATASSALAGLVGGPRILMAMGQHRIIPFSEIAAKTTADGNPRASVLFTAVLTLLFVMVRDLNTIAPLVTMFFLITYGMLNVVVLVESSLGLVSFRPTLRISRVIPFLGVAGCTLSMFIVSPTFGLVSVGLVVVFYFWIQRRVQDVHTEDVRSSVFVALAQWAASRVTYLDQENKRAWKPNLLVPVVDAEQVRGTFQLLIDLTRPDGSVTLLGLDPDADELPRLRRRLIDLSERLRTHGLQTGAAALRGELGTDGVRGALEALQAAFFRPNVLFFTLDREDHEHGATIPAFLAAAQTVRVGMIVVGLHPKAGLGERRRVNMWVQAAPGTWDAEAAFSSGHLNLNLLTGYRLMREWDADTTVTTVVPRQELVEPAEQFLDELFDLARLPDRVGKQVLVGSFQDCLRETPVADVNLMGLPAERGRPHMEKLIELARGTVIFVWDSGRESALV